MKLYTSEKLLGGVKKVENQKKEEQQSPSGYEINQVKSERVTPEYNLPQSDQVRNCNFIFLKIRFMLLLILV